MNKDLYIKLLEKHVEDLEAVSQIATRVTKRMCGEVGKLEAKLVSVRGRNAVQDELISKVADTAMDYQGDIDDLRADWAEDHAVLVGEIKNQDVSLNFSDMTLQEFERDIKVLTRHRDRFHGIIKELKKEKYDIGMELAKMKKQNESLKMQNENLIEDIETARGRIEEMEENK